MVGMGARYFPGELQIGARRADGPTTPDPHPWIEHRGVVLNDLSDIAQELPVFDRRSLPRRLSSSETPTN